MWNQLYHESNLAHSICHSDHECIDLCDHFNHDSYNQKDITSRIDGGIRNEIKNQKKIIQMLNKEKLNANTVGGAAHSDPKTNKTTMDNRLIRNHFREEHTFLHKVKFLLLRTNISQWRDVFRILLSRRIIHERFSLDRSSLSSNYLSLS